MKGRPQKHFDPDTILFFRKQGMTWQEICRISKTSRGDQYCFVSSWADGIVVHVDLTRAGVDSFQVVREEEQNDH